MGSLRRQSIAFFASVLLHGSVMVWGSFSLFPDVEIPEIEFEFTEVEMIDPEQIQGEQAGEPEEPPLQGPIPPPPVQGPEIPEELEKKEEAPEEEKKDEQEDEEAKRHLGKKSSKADELGPTNSTFYALLVPKKIRGLPFAQHAMDIMAPLPDFEYIITQGGFDPLHDFDHLVIASPDLRDLTQTFLAVDYRMSESEMVAGLERAAAANDEEIEWIEENGIKRANPRPIDSETPDIDPRWFVLLDDGIAVYVREEFLPSILEDEVGDEKTSGNFVANLTRLRRFSSQHPTAGLQVVFKDLRAALKRARGLPFEAPDRIELLAEASKQPELSIKVEFLTAVDAKAAAQWWTQKLGRLIDDNLTLKFTVKWIYDLLEVEADGTKLQLWGRFTTGQAEKTLELIADGSRKMLRKTPEEIEAARQKRIENWKRRQGGKLQPSAVQGAAGIGQPDDTPSRQSTDQEPAQTDITDQPPPAAPSGQPELESE